MGAGTGQRAENGCGHSGQRHSRARRPGEAETGARTGQGRTPGRVAAEGAGRPQPRAGDQDPGAQQHERICRALRLHIFRVMLECSLRYTTSAETKLRMRAMDLLRARKKVNVPWWGRPQPFHRLLCSYSHILTSCYTIQSSVFRCLPKICKCSSNLSFVFLLSSASGKSLFMFHNFDLSD